MLLLILLIALLTKVFDVQKLLKKFASSDLSAYLMHAISSCESRQCLIKSRASEGCSKIVSSDKQSLFAICNGEYLRQNLVRLHNLSKKNFIGSPGFIHAHSV